MCIPGSLSKEDLESLKDAYESAHGKDLDRIMAEPASSFYHNCSPLYTVLRRVFRRDLLAHRESYPIPTSLRELSADLTRWHAAIDPVNFKAERVPDIVAAAALSAACSQEDLPMLLVQDREKTPTLHDLRRWIREKTNIWPLYWGYTPDFAVIAQWRLERNL